MNILIVGEFSSLSRNLKIGFKELGHSACILTCGDGTLKIPSEEDDIHYNVKLLKIFRKSIKGSWRFFVNSINRQIESCVLSKFVCPPDIILIINVGFLRERHSYKIGLPIDIIENWKLIHSKVIMSCCGWDPAFNLYVKQKKIIFPKIYRYLIKPSHKKSFNKLINMSDVIIPITLDYYNSINNYVTYYQLEHPYIAQAIPVPINIENYSLLSSANRKIVIFHGLSRPKEKGSAYFVEAMQRIQQKYPDNVECIISKKLPYSEYKKVFRKIDVLCDQVYGNGMGMNAALGIMNAKIVLGGNSLENERHLGLPNCPILNVEPDSNQIYEVLESLIKNPDQIDVIKKASREYAEKNLRPAIISQKYIEEVSNL